MSEIETSLRKYVYIKPQVCAVRLQYDGSIHKECQDLEIKQIDSSKGLGKQISEDKMKDISSSAQIFLNNVSSSLKEHSHLNGTQDKTRIVFAGTILLLSKTPVQKQPSTQQNWISLIAKGREDTLDAILSKAAETVPDMPKVQIDTKQYSDEGLTSSSEDNMCANCRVELTDVLPKDNLHASSSSISLESIYCCKCQSKWCEPCGIYVRCSGQCACCFRYGTLEACRTQQTTQSPVSGYYTDGRKPHAIGPSPMTFPEIHTARRANDVPASDTESDDEVRQSNKMKKRKKYNKRNKRNSKKPTRRNMKHGDAIGIWRRRYICCGANNPYESCGEVTCRRRTWSGTLAQALKHVQQRHGISDIHWKETDTHWICMTGECELAAQRARHPITDLESTRNAFIVPIPQECRQSSHDKNSKQPDADDDAWERLVFEHMRNVHKIVHLSTREEAMPATKVRQINKRRRYIPSIKRAKHNREEEIPPVGYHPNVSPFPNSMPYYHPPNPHFSHQGYYPSANVTHPPHPPSQHGDSTYHWGGPPPPPHHQYGMYYIPYPQPPHQGQYGPEDRPAQLPNDQLIPQAPVEVKKDKEYSVAATLSTFSSPILDGEDVDVILNAEGHHPLPIEL